MNKLIKPGEQVKLAYKMRAACPLPGGEFDKFMQVELSPGQRVAHHAHKRHAVLYYPETADKLIVYPEAGTMLYLPPGTFHEVPPVLTHRISIAMLIGESK